MALYLNDKEFFKTSSEFFHVIFQTASLAMAIFKSISKNLSDHSSLSTNLFQSGMIQAELDIFMVCFNCK